MAKLPGLTAARLIELLAQHIAEHGKDAVVMLRLEDGMTAPVVRCWFNPEDKQIELGEI